MIEEKAVVVAADERWLQVKVSGEEACETCDLSEQCYRDDGLLKIDRTHIHGSAVDAAKGIDGLGPGRSVKLTMENTSLLALTGVVYGVPLLLFALGLAVGYFLLLPDAGEAVRALGSFAAGLGLVAAAWLLIVRLDRRMARRIRYRVDLPDDSDDAAEDYYKREYSSEE